MVIITLGPRHQIIFLTRNLNGYEIRLMVLYTPPKRKKRVYTWGESSIFARFLTLKEIIDTAETLDLADTLVQKLTSYVKKKKNNVNSPNVEIGNVLYKAFENMKSIAIELKDDRSTNARRIVSTLVATSAGPNLSPQDLKNIWSFGKTASMKEKIKIRMEFKSRKRTDLCHSFSPTKFYPPEVDQVCSEFFQNDISSTPDGFKRCVSKKVDGVLEETVIRRMLTSNRDRNHDLFLENFGEECKRILISQSKVARVPGTTYLEALRPPECKYFNGTSFGACEYCMCAYKNYTDTFLPLVRRTNPVAVARLPADASTWARSRACIRKKR